MTTAGNGTIDEIPSRIRRRAVVTGAARGLGRAMANGLLDAGHTVLFVDRDAQQVVEAVAQANEQRGRANAFSFACDLTQPGAVADVMFRTDEALGGIDILVNNAGVGPSLVSPDYFDNPPSFVDLSDDMVRFFFEINAVAPFLLAIHAARRMREQNWGRVVNVTTSHESMMRRGFAPYGGTKAALESHSAIMAQDLAGTGVTVNVLVPGGPADTPMIPLEAGFDRSKLVPPQALVAPLAWLVSEGNAAPNGKRVLAATWTPEAATATSDASVAPIGWPLIGRTIMPNR
ncbi:SDR family NAD(P)-dependent oxidoreductase [Paraburkholderia metrosideri]|uniref:SDR family NAD(P)-dependent oxidoreductase n=1 Tax=Paraburkholderia metrosideri TaxID=580937 RepID=A0ABW9E3F1_9BURK